MNLRVILAVLLGVGQTAAFAADPLADGWSAPPRDARLRAYWWWLNGNVTKEAITRDLEEMKAKGFGGALICDADGASQDGNDKVPHGPTFMSAEWRELYKHTLREADRLGLEMSLNIQSGWNLGGPMVKPDDAPKKLVWTECLVTGPENVEVKLESPKGRDGYYRDLFVVACRINEAAGTRKPLQNQKEKALLAALHPFSAPDSSPLFAEFPATPGEEDTRAGEVLDLTKMMRPDGMLSAKLPSGKWGILRIGCTLNDSCRVSTCSEGWQGYALDPFDAGAFRRYWDAVVEPLIADAGPLAGKTLRYLHTDSWEVEVANWTPTLREEFRKRRGYDLLPWLPVIAGHIINSRDESNRFLHDYRRTIGDLAIANHYQLFRDGAHKHGMLIHPESGGPHAVPIDAQQCLGFNDAPMSEFWAWSPRHRVGDANRFFVKQPASAAHTYGRKLVLAEGFTTIGPHWQETLWDNLKPSFDKALCEGLNLLVWHAFVCSPASAGVPGQQYFAGTHLNPNVTWWSRSRPFFAYINRCQWMLQQGMPVADVACYYGDHVPNFTQLKQSDPAKALPGYDYDVITAETLTGAMSVRDGRLALPHGVSYRVLVLPDRNVISLPVLRKLKELVNGGATVIGRKPVRDESLTDYPQGDAGVAAIADELWGKEDTATGEHRCGAGRVVWGKTARAVLQADHIKPDVEFTGGPDLALDSFHRRDGATDIYFVASRAKDATTATCAFRVSGKAPELWDAVTGERRFAAFYQESDSCTRIPLEFAPYGSWFVVFREPAAAHPASRDAVTAGSNSRKFKPLAEFGGAWTARFPAGANTAGNTAPASDLTKSHGIVFAPLVSWTTRPEPEIRYFSGTATYTRTFEWKAGHRDVDSEIWLDLGVVHELAEVRVNGKACGIVWAPPFRVNITHALVAGSNELAVDVVNFWPNRIIGDASLPPERRSTKTNIRKLTAATALMESGLVGPVQLMVAAAGP